jgi:cell wall-associated NlpC family hydrolase
MPLETVQPVFAHPNVRTPAAAVRWAAGQINHPSQPWKGLCLQFVARAYGWRHSGYTTAWRQWEDLPERYCHYNANAPVGALQFWKGGTTGAGHVALAAGGGKVLTTGWGGFEGIRLVSAASITAEWHMHDARWSDPVFLKGS